MLRQYKLRDYNFRLILWVVILSVLGIMIIGSADKSYQSKQIIGLVIGIACMVAVSLMDYSWLLRFYWIFYVIGIILLILVRIFGTNVNGARRWITINGFTFQPSDVMKIILILFFTSYFLKNEEKLNHPLTILKSLVFLAIPWYLIEDQPDLSTSVVVLLIFCAMYFVAGLSSRLIGGIIAICIPLALIAVTLITQPDQTILEDYQYERIAGWLDPESYPDISYQQTNSEIAIGSGQLYGKGLNNSDVNSVKNGNFIAEPQTDFIFAVAGEELGFLGCCLIVILEFLIAIECILAGLHAREVSGTLICCGMAALIAFQSFINICVTTGLLPNTGLTLPFVSYGLTSLISLYIGIGLVLNIGLQVRKY